MIRHFNLGDILLLQRLGPQAAKLNIERAVTSPRTTSRVALTTFFPWITTKVITYVLPVSYTHLTLPTSDLV